MSEETTSQPTPRPIAQWWRAVWVVIGIIIVCSWCSLLSGFGGWLIGYDLGKREARAALLPGTGVLVTRVEQGGPAERAGIVRSDMITAVNGIAVYDVVALREQLLTYRPGDTLLVTYRHDLGEQATYLILGHYPGSFNQPYLGIYYTARADEPADM